jgi:hypothetical protein
MKMLKTYVRTNNMKDLITFEYKKFNNIRHNMLAIILIVSTTIALTLYSKLVINSGPASVKAWYFMEIFQYLYIFWGLTNIILPFFYLKYFQVSNNGTFLNIENTFDIDNCYRNIKDVSFLENEFVYIGGQVEKRLALQLADGI